MYMKNRKVIIRSAQLDDVNNLCNWWASGEVMAHAGFPNGLSTDESKLVLRINEQNIDSLPENQLIIIELENDYPIGEMNYRKKLDGVFEIGIKICVLTEQSKGYGTTAIKSLTAFLKNEMKANKIILNTNLKNIGAQKFYKNLGFKQTQILKDCWTDQLGNLQGAVFFEMDLM